MGELRNIVSLIHEKSLFWINYSKLFTKKELMNRKNMAIRILISFITLFLLLNESSAADKQLGEQCGACFSINIPVGCGLCASGLECLPQKDEFGIILDKIEAPWTCINLTAYNLAIT